MRYLYLALVAWFIMSCAGDDGGMRSKPWPPSGNDTHDTAVETDTDTDSDVDSDTDADADTDTALNECAEAATLCGMDIETVQRSVWWAPLTTQNPAVGATSETIISGLVAGTYPPIPFDVGDYAAKYDVGDELNERYGYGAYSDTPDWAASLHSPFAVTIHYFAGEISSTCDAIMQSTANDHSLGWNHFWGDIGYHIVVCQDGSGIHVYEGRMCTSEGNFSSMWCVGAHTSGYNTGYVGISLVTLDDPNEEEFEAMTEVATRVMYEAGITDETVIKGHRDYGATECPGDGLYSRLGEIQDRVAWCQDTCGYAPPTSPPFVLSVPSPTWREFQGD